MSFAGVVLNPAKTAEVLRGPNGPVMRHALERAERVRQGAKNRVGVKTGKLRSSIVKRVVPLGPQGAEVLVGSDQPHALFHHEGTRPHVIVPRNASVLVFDVGGQTVFARRVNHPGTKPNRFLVDAARAEGLKVRLTRGGFI